MFCSQCGKKVMDTMLFCPFCGSAIVIPGQKEAVAVPPETPAEKTQPQTAPEEIHLELPDDDRSKPLLDFEPLDLKVDWSKEEIRPLLDPEQMEEEEAFEPLDLDDEADEASDEATEEKPEDISGEISELLSSQLKEEPVRLQGRVPNLTGVHHPAREKKNGRAANTYAPVKAFNPDDMFLDGEDEEEDDYDDDSYVYEEAENENFFVRHIRGVVAMTLFLVVLAILAGWSLSSAGQTALARANLAWQPQVYEKLGYQAYQEGRYDAAADYYVKALARDDDNFEYAYSAGVAYYMGQDTERAAEMGKKSIQISSSRKDGYVLLQRLYPDPATRPWEIQQLIQQGYQLTGEASLNDAAQ